MMTLNDVLTKRKCALLIIDVQNDFCHPNGLFASRGQDMSVIEPIMQPIQALIDGAHQSNVPVFFIKNTEDEALDSEAWQNRPDGAEDLMNTGVCRRGSDGAKLYKLIPKDGDIEIEKPRFSAFFQTNLDSYLRSLKVETVVLCGVATNICVETTARHAIMLNYHVVAAKDCCSTWDRKAHDAAIDNIRKFFGRVTDAKTIITAWNA